MFVNKNVDEKDILELVYSRTKLNPGDEISGVQHQRKIKDFLDAADEVIISMYWKPLGDSFLFLSVAQAVYDYKVKLRKEKVSFVLDKKFSDLIKKVEFLNDAKVVDSGLDYFKESFKSGKKIFLVTDDDPFWENKDVPVFNSEEYKYPRYVISEEDIVYSSRPSRYYLTFEMELGIRLFDPNKALPFFLLQEEERLEKKVVSNYGINLKKDQIAVLISQTSKVEKKFGLLKYLEIAKRFLEKEDCGKVVFFVNPHEESPSIWLRFKDEIRSFSDRIILYPYDSDDFVEMAYLFARAKFVLGNDTGFSHLAVMSKEKDNSDITPTYIIYSKHDFTKWTTGYSTAITTKLAKFLADNNLSVRREKINQEEWGDEAFAYSISVDDVVKYLSL
jgi:hypothetical protein